MPRGVEEGEEDEEEKEKGPRRQMEGGARASGQQPRRPAAASPPPAPVASQDDDWADEDEEREDLPPPPPPAKVERGARLGELKVKVPRQGRKEEVAFPIHVKDSPSTLQTAAKAFVKKYSLPPADAERIASAAVRKHGKMMKK